MPLSFQQKKLITDVHIKVGTILLTGGDEDTILAQMSENMPDIYSVITSVPNEELDRYIREHECYGFHYYMKILEFLATAIAKGDIKVPT